MKQLRFAKEYMKDLSELMRSEHFNDYKPCCLSKLLIRNILVIMENYRSPGDFV